MTDYVFMTFSDNIDVPMLDKFGVDITAVTSYTGRKLRRKSYIVINYKHDNAVTFSNNAKSNNIKLL